MVAHRAAADRLVGAARATSTGAAWSTWRRCASGPAIVAGRAAGRGPALVHGGVRPRQPAHQLPGDAVRARAGGVDAAGARAVPGPRRRSVPRRGAGQDPARAPPRRADRVRGAAALALLRRRRLDDAVPDRPRGVRALDGRPRARARAGAAGARGDRAGSTSTATATATATSSTSAATRRPASRTSAGRTRGTRSRSPTARSRRRRARPASSRVTCTTPRCRTARLAREVLGATPRGPGSSRTRRPS